MGLGALCLAAECAVEVWDAFVVELGNVGGQEGKRAEGGGSGGDVPKENGRTISVSHLGPWDAICSFPLRSPLLLK